MTDDYLKCHASDYIYWNGTEGADLLDVIETFDIEEDEARRVIELIHSANVRVDWDD